MLEDPVSGTVSTTETIEGTIAEYSCILGHVLSSDAPRVCERNANQLLGNWSNVEPTCDSKPRVSMVTIVTGLNILTQSVYQIHCVPVVFSSTQRYMYTLYNCAGESK